MMDGQQLFVEVGMDWSIFDGNLVKIPFLTFNDQEYSIVEVTYPPFIALAHEFGHLVHYMDTYKELRDTYGDAFPAPPSIMSTSSLPWEEKIEQMRSSTAEWRQFTQRVCIDKGYPRFFHGIDGGEGQQATAYRVCSKKKLDDIIWSRLERTLERTDANVEKCKRRLFFLGFFGTGPVEEEILNIMCDPVFNDRIFLKDACECGLLQLSQEIRNGMRCGCVSSCFPTDQTSDEYRECIANITRAVRFLAPLLPPGLIPPDLRPSDTNPATSE
ncbi:MAG: hypothetical protein LBF25_02735 [Puniceicoccales bacterium]|jgi:hypothetical protein|nr:hypothetical protein [Puniceicoccales bacterium]